MLLFCKRDHITTVRVHQIAPLTHEYPHTITSGPNDRLRARKSIDFILVIKFRSSIGSIPISAKSSSRTLITSWMSSAPSSSKGLIWILSTPFRSWTLHVSLSSKVFPHIISGANRKGVTENSTLHLLQQVQNVTYPVWNSSWVWSGCKVCLLWNCFTSCLINLYVPARTCRRTRLHKVDKFPSPLDNSNFSRLWLSPSVIFPR